MNPQRLLTDVNLYNIIFVAESSGLVFEFLNMSNGDSSGNLVCTGIMQFNYQADHESGLPLYIGEVDHEVISGADVLPTLKQLGYDMRAFQDGTPMRGAEQIHRVRMDGSATIEVFCTGSRFVPPE